MDIWKLIKQRHTTRNLALLTGCTWTFKEGLFAYAIEISNWLFYIIFQTFRLVFKPLGLKEHQLRPQDFGEANLDTLKNRGNAYLPEKPPPYHLDMQLNVCIVYLGISLRVCQLS